MKRSKKLKFLLPVAVIAIFSLTGIGQMKQKINKLSGYAPINGLKIYYEIHGATKNNEPPLILLHGGGSTIETTFGKILPLLAKNRKVIAFDQQGHGRTADIDDRPFSFEQSADDAAELLKYLKISKADFFGFSNGGNILYHFAIRHPGLIRKLVIASASSKRDGFPAEFWEGMKNPKIEYMPLPLREEYLRTSPHPKKLQSFFDKSAKRMQEFQDVPDEMLRSINAPTLLIIGDKDNVRPEHAVEMFRLLPNARLIVLPSDHGGYLGETIANQKSGKIERTTVALIEEFFGEQAANQK